MNSKEPTSVRDRILAKIERNEVRMHSRTFFALKVAGVGALAGIMLLLSVFIGNLVFFTLRLNGHGELLSLGTQGIGLFIRLFPWWLVALDAALGIALVWLVRHFQFGYRKPVLSIFFGMVALALLAGFALDQGTPLNDRLLRDADDGLLPSPLQSVYQGARRPPPDGSAFRGTITAVAQDSFTLEDPDSSRTLTVMLSPGSRGSNQGFSVGQTVFVVGEENNGVVIAHDVHVIDPNGLPPHGHGGDHPH